MESFKLLTTSRLRYLLENPLASEAEWTKVLDLSYRWQSPFLRQAAFQKLSAFPSVDRLRLCLTYNIDEWKSEVYETLCRRTSPLTPFERNSLRLEHQNILDDCLSGLCVSAIQGLLAKCSGTSGSSTSWNCANLRLTRARVVFDLLNGLPPSSTEAFPQFTTSTMTSGLCSTCVTKLTRLSIVGNTIAADCVKRMLQLPQVIEPEVSPNPLPFFDSYTISPQDVARLVSFETLTPVAVDDQPGDTFNPEVTSVTVMSSNSNEALEGADGRNAEQPIHSSGRRDAPSSASHPGGGLVEDWSTNVEGSVGEVDVLAESTGVPAVSNEIEGSPQPRAPSPTPLSDGGYSFC